MVPPPPAGADTKAQARWLLATAREQIRAGNYDDAAAKVAQARGLNARWGLFDDTPAKVEAVLAKARPKAVVTTASDAPRDRADARQRLREARAAIDAKHPEQAEAIAMDVKSWGLSYGMFEDSPDKVAAAARAPSASATSCATAPRVTGRASRSTTSSCRSHGSSPAPAASTRPRRRRSVPSG